jgi:hypothetical protein
MRDGAGQLAQARLDLALDGGYGQRQRDLALELLKGFHIHGHGVLSLTEILDFKLVRGGGLEPPHHCWRQDLNLVRLPISPPARLLRIRCK